MPKDEKPEKDNIGKVSPKSITAEMEQSYLDYAMSVIIARALPDVRDGLKPVHRRILYAMNEMGLTHSARYTKSAKIVGEVLGKYHPHGDLAVYDTMVGMAQTFKMSHPLVDGQGNFGSLDGDPPAAQRYTEARMSAIAAEMLTDIDKKTVDFTDNYDNTLKEPTVLPSKIPNLLVNGTVGIAVGMATNIPPHNLGELCEATVTLIDSPQATLEELMGKIQGPDFPTGGTLHGLEGIKNAFATGRGKVVIRGEAEIVEEKRGFQIVISSIPFQVNKSELISKIAQLAKEKKLEGITDIRDESDRSKAVRIVIELKSSAYPKKILNRLYELTGLQTAFHINMLALVDRLQPRVLNLRGILQEFIKHRQQIVRRRSEFELTRAKERAHILEGLKKALDKIDRVIETIKKSANREAAAKNLISKFSFTSAQANAILDMRLSALAALERQKVEDELKQLMERIKELEAILADENKIFSIIKEELKQIKEKYAVPRRTKIIAEEIGSFQAEDLIPDETVVVTLTRGNYIKRVSADAYRKQGRGGKGIVGITPKEEDLVLQMETASTHDRIFFFTNLGRVFSSRVFEIPASSRVARGQAIVNLVQISPEENVTAMLIIPKKQEMEDKYFTFATKLGIVKRTLVSAYNHIRKTGLIAVKLMRSDELRFIRITSGQDYIIMATKAGSGILFKEEEARPMGRSAAGVIGIRPRSGDEVIAMSAFSQQPEAAKDYEIVTLLENGLGKRTAIIKHFPAQRRGGYGVRAAKLSAKTGQMVETIITNEIEQDLILVSMQGQVIRIPLKSAKLLGRDTQGVRLMRLKKGDRVASVSVINEKGTPVKDPTPQAEDTIPQTEIPEDEAADKNPADTRQEKKIDLSDLKINYYNDRKDGREKN